MGKVLEEFPTCGIGQHFSCTVHATASEETLNSNVDLVELTEMKTHGLPPKFGQGMGVLEPAVLSNDNFLEMLIHGVMPEYVREMRVFGLNHSAGKLIEMRVHGVSPDYVREMESLGLDDLTPERLVEMSVHGVDAGYVRTMKKIV